MLDVTNDFQTAIMSDNRQLSARIKIKGTMYSTEDIVSISFDSGSIVGETFAIGSTNSNSIKVVMCQVIEDIEELDEVVPEIAVRVADGSYEFVSLGHFVVTEYDPDRNNNQTTLTCSDRMILMNGTYESKLEYPAEIRAVALEIANLAGAPVDESNFSRLLSTKIDQPTGYTYRQAIGLIAQFHAGFATFNREGNLEIRTLSDPAFEVKPTQYFLKGLTKKETMYRVDGISCTVRKIKKENDYETTEEITFQAGITSGNQIVLENNVMTQVLLDSIFEKLANLTYYPYSLSWQGNPALEAGDWITLADTKGNKFKVPNLTYSLEFKGGLSAKSSADSTSQAQGTFQFNGPLKQVVRYLNARISADGGNAVYQGIDNPVNPKESDIWFKSNGPDTEIWIYERNEEGKLEWSFKVSSADNPEIKEAIDQAKNEAQTALNQSNDAVAKANQNAIDVGLAGQTASEALANANSALSQLPQIKTDISNVVSDLGLTDSNVAGIKVDVDEATGQLSVLSGKVDSNETRIGEIKTDYDGFKASYGVYKNNNDNKWAQYNASASGWNSSISSLETNALQYKGTLSGDASLDNLESGYYTLNGVTSITEGKYWGKLINSTESGHIEQIAIIGDSVQYVRSKQGYPLKWNAWRKSADDRDVTTINNVINTQVQRINNMANTVDGFEQTIGIVTFDLSRIDKQLNWQTVSTDADLSDYKTTGKYFFTKNAKNAPDVAWFYLTVDTRDSGRIIQTFQRDNSTILYRRIYVSDAQGARWSEWQQQARQIELNQVKETADKSWQQISKVNFDGAGQVDIAKYNTRLSSAEGNVVTIQNNLKDKADKTTVTEMANQFNVKVQTIQTDLGKKVENKNYISSNSGSSDSGKWTKFLTTTIDYQYGKVAGSIEILENAGGQEGNYYAKIYYNHKLQDSVGSRPKVELSLTDSRYLSSDLFKAVISSDNKTIDWYMKIPGTYQQYRFNPIMEVGDANGRTYLASQGFVQNLPSGTQINGIETGNLAQLTVLSDQINLRVQKNDIVNQINISTEGVLIAGKKIWLTGETKIDSGIIKNAMIDSLSASKLTAGTINAALVNVININANNISAGIISGRNLTINLDTGFVTFQKGRIQRSDGLFNIDIDNGLVESYTSIGGFTLKNGDISFLKNPNPSGDIDPNTQNSYGAIKWLNWLEGMKYGTFWNDVDEGLEVRGATAFILRTADANYAAIASCTGSGVFGGMGSTGLTAFSQGDINIDSNSKTPNSTNGTDTASIRFTNKRSDIMGTMDTVGKYIIIQGGKMYGDSGQIMVGQDSTKGFIKSVTVYNRTSSEAPNMVIDYTGILKRSTSASKYKLNISEALNAKELADNVLSLHPKTWFDRFSAESYAMELETGQRIGGVGKLKPYYGLIAEDLANSGLEMFCTYGEDGELEGIQYDRIWTVMIPKWKEMDDHISDILSWQSETDKRIKKLEDEIKRLKEAA